MQASELFAISQGSVCSGDDLCHWCGSPAARDKIHDDEMSFTGSKSNNPSRAAHPSRPFVCHACWMWRRKYVTVPWLRGGYKDRRCAMDHSWWITPDGAWAIDPTLDGQLIHDRLLKPPRQFMLAIIDTPGTKNLLHLLRANSNMEVKGDTALAFTIDCIPHNYTVYEMEQALLHGGEGKEPGVQALLRIFGKSYIAPSSSGQIPAKVTGKDDGRAGRPGKEDKAWQESNDKRLKRTVRMSGS